MMLAETTINYYPIIGAILLCFGCGLALIRGGQWYLSRKPSDPESSRNSDQPAPRGFAAHASLICNTAPAATPAIREQYLLGALTEAQVLRAECERLASHVEYEVAK
jgi:hypothetical protein